MMTNSENAVLPPLRQDLEILPGDSFWTGAPSWMIHDRVRNRYFRIGREALDLLVNWRSVPPEKLAQAVANRCRSNVQSGDVEAFAKFLMTNSLVISNIPEAWRDQIAQSQATKRSVWKSLVHNYLFFKIPLFRPQAFLDAAWPVVAPLFTRSAAIVFALLALICLYLVSRQWSLFTSTLMDFLTVEGFLLYAASLVFIKAIHELGHAFMARKYQCHVAVIGIAFIVMMPILYTDTTSAHRLTDRRKRLNIDLAGIYAELALASIATLFWIFLPDGPLRSVAFSTATLSWVMSLAVNLNPFMRFDGYYILCDLTGFENLQERGFAIAKWRLREMLFSLKAPMPELLLGHWILPIVLHAWGTWIYRFFLFLGIAVLVYAFFIKIIGIALFVIEICWFIVLPILREISTWWQSRDTILKSRRSLCSLAILISALALLAIPWSGSISMPAIAKTEGLATLFVADEAVIVSHALHEGRKVKAGELLASLASPDLDEKISRTFAEQELLRKRLSRLTADAEENSLRLVFEQELQTNLKEAEGLQKLKNRLEIRAPVSGTLVNVDTELHEGLWVNPQIALARIRPEHKLQITALGSERNVTRIGLDTAGKFIPENLQLPTIDVTIRQIGNVSLFRIEDPMFSDLHGGQVSVRRDADSQSLVPRATWFPVRLSAANAKTGRKYDARLATVQRGTVILQGKAESYFARIGRQMASVLLREAGL